MTESEATAALAATCQGWSYALNAVARPAAEHLEAAQAALKALGTADREAEYAGTADALSAALEAARARLAPHSLTVAEAARARLQPREVTVADLVEAVAQLRAAGLIPFPALLEAVDGPPAGADRGISELREAHAHREELEAELARAKVDGHAATVRVLEEWRSEFAQALGAEDAEEDGLDLNDLVELAQEQTDQLAEALKARDIARERLAGAERRAAELERQRRDAVSKLAAAHGGRVAAVAAAQRSQHLAVLALLGTSGPGFDQMAPEELADAMGSAVRRVARESAAVPRMVEELTKAWRRLVDVQSGPPSLLPEDPEELAKAVRTEAVRVCATLGGTREAIRDQAREITELRQGLGRSGT